jgi:hypothetical protein
MSIARYFTLSGSLTENQVILPLYFRKKWFTVNFMAEQRRRSVQGQQSEDVWGGGGRQGYEDLPFRQPRTYTPQKKGSRFLRSVGGMMVVTAVAWLTYMITSVNGLDSVLKPGTPSPPVFLLAGGLLVLLIEKLFR